MADTDPKPPATTDDKPKSPKAAEKERLDVLTQSRDFTELADAQDVADAIGGTVTHVGVAFHVNDPE